MHTRTPTSLHPSESSGVSAPSRRAFIRLAGGGAVLAATAALTGCSGELPEAAVQPWRSPKRETDTRRFMLAHA
ncbi:MAG: twin-arginine translocation signal domain-containing protein, partial [Rubrivivax sp.]